MRWQAREEANGEGVGGGESVGAIVGTAVHSSNVGDVERRCQEWLEVVAMMVVIVLR
jgi:hypothetical protein